MIQSRLNQPSPKRSHIPARANPEAYEAIQQNAKIIANADPTRSKQQKLAVQRGVIDAYNYGVQASPRPQEVVVEPYQPDAEIDGYVAPKKRKTRGAASAAKTRGPGKLESFKLKEREKEYNRRAKELDDKIAEAKKDSVLQALLKQKRELDHDYYDVLSLRQTPVKKATRRQSATVKKSMKSTKSAVTLQSAQQQRQTITLPPSPGKQATSTTKLGIYDPVSQGSTTPATMPSSNFKTDLTRRNQQIASQDGESAIRRFTITEDQSATHQPRFSEKRTERVESTYSAMQHVPVTTDLNKNDSDFVPVSAHSPGDAIEEPRALNDSAQRRSKAERKSIVKPKAPPLEMIDGTLTVKIEDDLFQRTGKPAPQVVNRASPGMRAQTATKVRPAASKSVGKQYSYTAAKKASTPLDVRLHAEFGISLGNKMFKNETFDRKIADVQRKIEELKNQSAKGTDRPESPVRMSPKKGGLVVGEEKVDQFYNEMAKFYEKPPKHESPTRRLRQQIDTAFTHKGFLSQQPEFQADRQNYGLTYVVGVSKTYVVQPERGELPYELAEKKPLAFYREVMEGDVKEHKITKSPKRKRPQSGGLPMRKSKKRRPLQYETQIKKRSIARILNTVQNKLRRLISDVTTHSPDAIERALSNPEAEKILKRQITDGSIQLVDQQSQSPVYTRQMSKIGQKGFRAAAESPGASDLDASCTVEPEDAELKVKAAAMNELVTTVDGVIRRQASIDQTQQRRR